MYRPADRSIWDGRTTPPLSYMHQVIQPLNLADPVVDQKSRNFTLLGFSCDEGVVRNHGRKGAAQGPTEIRKALANLSIHTDPSVSIYDSGNIICKDKNLESAFEQLIDKVELLQRLNCRSILLGGGHEITYPHFMGLHKANKEGIIGIINLDPHLDIRIYPDGSHSGSSLRQISDEIGTNFRYLPIGINPAVNPQELFATMNNLGQHFVSMDKVKSNLTSALEQIVLFADQVDHLYVTIDMDVFNSAFAPGVSAPAAYGFLPEEGLKLIDAVMETGKVISVDIAETNPLYDIDGRTSRLAALLVHRIIHAAW